MTHQTDHESTADKAAVTPPPALTTEGRLRARVQTLEEDAERNQGLAKVGARCMREGHQGLIESGRATVEGHRFALSVKLGLGTDATWDAIHERVKELRVDSAAPAAVSAAVAPPTQAAPSHRAGLRDRLAAAIWERTPEAEPTRHGLVMGNPHGLVDAVLAVLYREWPWLRAEAEEAPADRAAELAKHVTRAIFALKSPPPSGSEHYRSGWDDGLEAAIDAARDELLRRMADETATRSDVGTEFARQADQPDEAGLAAWEGSLTDETATETQRRCPSCDHEAKYHAADDGRCWFTVDHGVPGANLVCPCIPRDPGDDEPAAGARQDGAES